jgi:hypothetical protein
MTAETEREDEIRGYLRGLHDAWHHVHVSRSHRAGIDTYYWGVVHSQNVIGELWRNAGRTDPIGGSCYDEFPVTDLDHPVSEPVRVSQDKAQQ